MCGDEFEAFLSAQLQNSTAQYEKSKEGKLFAERIKFLTINCHDCFCMKSD